MTSLEEIFNIEKRIAELKEDPVTKEIKELEKKKKTLMDEAITGAEYEEGKFKMTKVDKNNNKISPSKFIKLYPDLVDDIVSVPLSAAKKVLTKDQYNEILETTEGFKWEVQEMFWKSWSQQ